MATQARNSWIVAACAATLASLPGCGGGGGSMSTPNGGSTPQMQLAVADAPVDGATSVVVTFTGVELTANAGNPVTINFAQPKSIDLVTQSGTASAVLFNQPIPPGSYGQIRLMIVADGSTAPGHSYMVVNGNTVGLQVPSGMQTGLKLVSGFTVPSSGVVDYTIDFDLRQSITCPPGHAPACTLKPALRLVDDTAVGNIQGTVTSAITAACASPGVYLYGAGATRYEDNNTTLPAWPASINQPVASKLVGPTSSPPYYYQFTFLQPGTYTVAYTCEAAQDVPDQFDFGTVTLTPIGTATVLAGATQTVDIAVGAVAGTVTALPSGCSMADVGIYLYAGAVGSPKDLYLSSPDPTTQPIGIRLPDLTASYAFAGLGAGTYTVAFTCQANLDGAATDDSAQVTFNPVKQGIGVSANQTTTVNFP